MSVTFFAHPRHHTLGLATFHFSLLYIMMVQESHEQAAPCRKGTDLQLSDFKRGILVLISVTLIYGNKYSQNKTGAYGAQSVVCPLWQDKEQATILTSIFCFPV